MSIDQILDRFRAGVPSDDEFIHLMQAASALGYPTFKVEPDVWEITVGVGSSSAPPGAACHIAARNGAYRLIRYPES